MCFQEGRMVVRLDMLEMFLQGTILQLMPMVYRYVYQQYIDHLLSLLWYMNCACCCSFLLKTKLDPLFLFFFLSFSFSPFCECVCLSWEEWKLGIKPMSSSRQGWVKVGSLFNNSKDGLPILYVFDYLCALLNFKPWTWT